MIGKVRLTLLALLFSNAFDGGLRGPQSIQAQVPGAPSTIRGWVLEHETERPLAGVLISLTRTGIAEDLPTQEEESVQRRSTGEEGGFLFQTLLPGIYRLDVSLLGYQELLDTLQVGANLEMKLTLQLSVSPIRLEPIVVISRRGGVGPLVGFETRRLRTGGYFLNREQIEASVAYEFSDLLRRAPGIRFVPDPPYKDRVYFRGGCVPDLWVDGTLAGTTPDIDSFLRPEVVEAVEVYHGAELPIEFGSNLCGAIIVWTRRGRSTREDPGRRMSLRGQMILAGSLLFLSGLALGLFR